MEKAQTSLGRKRKADSELLSTDDKEGKKKVKQSDLPKNENSIEEKKSQSKNEKKESIQNKIIGLQSSLDTFIKTKEDSLNNSLKNDSVNKSNITNNIFNSDKVEAVLNRPELKGKELTIFSWNVNGFRAVMGKGAVRDFIKAENPDILCFNETKIDEKIIKRENYESVFSEFNCYWNCCKTKGGYSGVAIFTKHKPLNAFNGINFETHDKEGRVLTLEFENYFLVSAYVPNSGRGLDRLNYRVKEWDVEFMKFIENLKETKDVILCGDLNVAHKEIDIFKAKGHLKSAGFTLEERNNFTRFLLSGYVDTFRHLYPEMMKFSYFNDQFGKKNLKENKGWRLDYFIINNEALDRLVNSEILNEYDASDHSPIKLTWRI